jgi:hypothetical protein
METTYSSETGTLFTRATRRRIPEDAVLSTEITAFNLLGIGLGVPSVYVLHYLQWADQ